jgi:hypothetical protein
MADRALTRGEIADVADRLPVVGSLWRSGSHGSTLRLATTPSTQRNAARDVAPPGNGLKGLALRRMT